VPRKINHNKERTMNKTLTAIIVTAGAFIALGGSASAHSVIVDGSAVCMDDGNYMVNWSARSDIDRDKEWRLEIGPAWTDWQPDEQSFDWFTISPGTSTVAVANLRADFRPNGPTGVEAAGRVELAGTCTPYVDTTTTTPPTTVPPETTVPETTTPESSVVTTTTPTSAPVTSTPTELPETGSETRYIALIAGLALLAGVGFTKLARR
jgi:LPXTG-motif cell wall-anchored protein